VEKSVSVIAENNPKLEDGDIEEKFREPSPFELPELVKLVEMLSGKIPEVRKNLGKALGHVTHMEGVPESAKIRIKSTLARLNEKGEQDTNLILHVLSHEIGHLIDLLPDGLIKRGNILGHISGAKERFLKSTLGYKFGDMFLTAEDRYRLRKQAREEGKKKDSEYEDDNQIIEEVFYENPIYEVTGITPEDVKAIWTDTRAREKYPELYDFISRMSAKEKKEAQKAALKGLLSDMIENSGLMKKTKIGTESFSEFIIKNLDRKGAKRFDVQKRYRELIREEINKRRMFEVEVIREELKNLTQWLTPFDESVNKSYTDYRYSAAELYAEAVSTLLVKPKELKQRAPNFYKAFFNWFDARQHPKAVYSELQDIVTGGKKWESRRKDWYADFEEAQRKRESAVNKYKEIIKAEKILLPFKNLFKTGLADINSAALSYIEKYDTNGFLNQRQKVRNELEKRAYFNEKMFVYIKDVQNKVIDRMRSIGVDIHDLGILAGSQRVLNDTDRKGKFNPRGMNAKMAEELPADLATKYSPEQLDAMYESLQEFRDMNWEIMQDGIKAGMWSQEMVDNVLELNKDSYVAFAVTEYINNVLVTAGLYHGEGTFKGIENPIYSTSAKMLAIQKQIDRKVAFNMLYEALKDQESNIGKPFFIDVTPKKNEAPPKFVQTDGYKLLEIYDKGETKYYEVPRSIKIIFDTEQSNFQYYFNRGLTPLRIFKKGFVPLVTKYNIGWAFYSNILRDNIRTATAYYTIANSYGPQKVSLPKFAMYYSAEFFKGLAESAKYQWGKETKHSREMLKEGAMMIMDYQKAQFDNGNDLLRPIFQQMGLIEKGKGDNWWYNNKMVNVSRDFYNGMVEKNKLIGYPVKAVTGTFKAYMFLVSTMETQSKFTGYRLLRKHFDPETAAFFTRNYVGTPNARSKGVATRELDTIIPFFNMIVQSLRTGGDLAFSKKTAFAYYTAMSLTSILPAFVISLLKNYGNVVNDDKTKKMMDDLVGEDANQTMINLSKRYRKISGYYKFNYIPIPYGEDENGDPYYFALQMGEEQKFFYALSQYAFDRAFSVATDNSPEGLSYLANVGVGLTPSGSPLLKSVGNWYDLSRGVSPENFYGKDVLSPDQLDAGVRGWLKPMLIEQMNVAGLRQIAREISPPKLHVGREKYEYNKRLFLSRFLRKGGQGELEYYQRIGENIRKENANINLDVRNMMQDKFKEAFENNIDVYEPGSRFNIAKDVAKEYAKKYPEKVDKLPQKFRTLRQLANKYAVVSQESPYQQLFTALIFAKTNDEKIEILSKVYADMTYPEFKDIINNAMKIGVLTPGSEVLSKTMMKGEKMRKKKIEDGW